MSIYLALARVEFDYAAQTEEELTVAEDQLVWIIEDDDAEWFKVKLKEADSNGATGLVPASYLAPPTPLRTVTALYPYLPSRDDDGQLDNEEEIQVDEGESLLLLEDDGDWVLVARENNKGVGFVPATYVDSADSDAPAVEEEPEAPPSPVVAAPYVDPSERVAASNGNAKANAVKTWSVTEIDKKKKKKKGTLGIGNGAVFFASESDKTPVQQYPLSDLAEITSEKSKHLHLAFPDSVELHFVIGSKEAFEEIVEKLEDDRNAPPTKTSIPTVRFVPPPPPLQSTSSYSPPSPAAASISPPPRPYMGGKGDAVALYDFEAQGEDELDIVEGERLIVIVGGSDDADWIKCRKVGSNSEGVVPASYVQPDEVADAGPSEEELRAAEEEAAAEEADALALQAQLKRDAQDADKRRTAAAAKVKSDREAKDSSRKKEAAAQSARQKRLSHAPAAVPLLLPERGDGEREGERERGSSRSSAAKKPSANRVRTWKDRTGQFKVDAEFLGLNGSKIRLHKLNGVIIEVPMEKMSAEDTAYITKVSKRSTSADDDTPLAHIADREQRRDERHRRGQTAAEGVGKPSGSSSRSKPPAKKATDWFDFFLNAGCDMDDCTRYGNNFQRDRIDEDLLLDLEQSTMRSLGLREGDIIRVTKYIKEKYAPPPTPDKSDRDAQIAADAAMARALAGPTPPPPSLFTSASGGLKTTRRGRPAANGRQGSTPIDSAAIASATTELSKRSGTPEIARLSSPALSADAGRARSASTTLSGGFDDDAWTVKSAPSKPTTPAAAPPPAAAPVLPPIERATSAGPPVPTLSYNDGLLAQLGIGNRPPSAPTLQSNASYGSANGGYPTSTSPGLQGPRGPVAPVYQNQPLLNPLIPTQTGMNSFVPTRQPMAPQMTGYPMMGMSGYPSLMPQMTGMPQQQPMQMQQAGYLQPQQTGMYNPQQQQQQQSPSYNQQPNRFSPVQFNPTPPPPQPTTPTSSTTAQFQPSNVFASMKPGGFTNGTGPQEPGRYDALRPQPTGQVFSPQLQPQQTGFPLQPQPTGFGSPGYQQQQQQNGYGRQY